MFDECDITLSKSSLNQKRCINRLHPAKQNHTHCTTFWLRGNNSLHVNASHASRLNIVSYHCRPAGRSLVSPSASWSESRITIGQLVGVSYHRRPAGRSLLSPSASWSESLITIGQLVWVSYHHRPAGRMLLSPSASWSEALITVGELVWGSYHHRPAGRIFQQR